MNYDGFISYSHAADGLFAPALHRGLQRLAKPWNSRRALRVFRDETGLSTNPHLWSAIEGALDESEWFVLLASPEAAQSEWVNKEIAHWLTTQSVDHVLPVVTDGTWDWDANTGDFTADSTAVPDALRGALRDEPRHLDVRWARSETDLDLRNSRFRSAVADLAAPMHGIAKDELEGEDVRQHRRALRLARGGVGALAILVVIAVVFGGFALLQRNRADRQSRLAIKQSRLADARRLATIATSGARDDLSRSALLAIEANRLVNNAETRGAILNLAEDAAPVREIIHGSWDAAAVTADGTTVATVGPQGISLVDLKTRRSRSISNHDFHDIRSVSFSPNGNLLALGGNDVEILDTHSGEPARAPFRFAKQDGPERTLVVHVHFSPDGSIIAAIDDNGVGYLWSMASGAELAHFETSSYGGGTSNVAFSLDGRWLTVTDDHAVVYDARSFPGHRLKPRYGNPPFVGFGEFDVAFSPDGKEFATANGGSQVHFRDAATGAEVGAAITSSAGSLAFSPDGAAIATSEADGTVSIWNTRPSALVDNRLVDRAQLLGQTRDVISMSFTSAGDLVVLTTAEIVVLDPSAQLGHQLAPSTIIRGFGINQLVTAPDGRSIAAADGLGRVRIWDLTSGRLERTITATTARGYGAQAVAYQPGTHDIVVGAGDGTVTAWDVQTGRRTHEPIQLTPPNTGTNGNITPGRGVFGIAFDARGRTLAAATGDGRVAIIDPISWRVQRSIQLVDDAISIPATIAMSPDGNSVVLAGPRAVVISDRDGAHRRQADIGPFDAISMAIRPDGRLLAVSAGGGRILLVDAATAQVLSTLVSNHGEIDSLAFDSTGTTLAGGGSDGTVTLWSGASREPIGPPLTSNQGAIVGLAFSSDGNSLFTGGADLSLLRYDLRTPGQIDRLCAVIGRNLTPKERRTYLGEPNAGSRTCPNWPASR